MYFHLIINWLTQQDTGTVTRGTTPRIGLPFTKGFPTI